MKGSCQYEELCVASGQRVRGTHSRVGNRVVGLTKVYQMSDGYLAGAANMTSESQSVKPRPWYTRIAGALSAST